MQRFLLLHIRAIVIAGVVPVMIVALVDRHLHLEVEVFLTADHPHPLAAADSLMEDPQVASNTNTSTSGNQMPGVDLIYLKDIFQADFYIL